MRPKAEEGEEADDSERVLSRIKANYSGGDALRLRWEDGVFKAQLPETGIFGTIERRSADKAFLEALDKLTAQKRRVNASPNTSSFAPRLMVSMPQTKGFNRTQLHAAMERLFSEGRIALEEEGPASRRRSFIVRAEGEE